MKFLELNNLCLICGDNICADNEEHIPTLKGPKTFMTGLQNLSVSSKVT